MRVYTIEQMRALERRAAEAGHSYDAMMERAGRAVAEAVASWMQVHAAGEDGERGKVLVLAGPGNNGGDGLVAAGHLATAGHAVTAYLWRRDEREARVAEARRAGVAIIGGERALESQELREALAGADVVLDALLGTGASRPIEGELAALLERVADARARIAPNGAVTWLQRPIRPVKRAAGVVAVDLPTGVDGDTGEVDPVTVPADLTVTFAGPKVGMLLGPAPGVVGELAVADIGIPPAVEEQVGATAELLDPGIASRLRPRRPPTSHKGTFGRVMVIGGSANYVGAPALAALGAGRGGAGLVTLAVPNSIAPVLASHDELASMTWVLLPHDMGSVTPDALKIMRRRLPQYDALAIGMGLGQEEVTQRFIMGLLSLMETGEPAARAPIGFIRPAAEESKKSEPVTLPKTVLDADALNALPTAGEEWWRRLPSDSLVLTPHPGEMSRLCGKEIEEIQANRLDVARERAAAWRQIVVLKGAYTVIAAPDGRLSVAPFASAALATAGTGDVLAGLIASLLAQGLDTYDAARLGVYLHGLAGVLLAQWSPMPLSSDLPAFIADAWSLLS